MVNPLFGSEITFHPAILHFEGYNCNYQCYYCYAKNKKYDFKLKSVINLINKSKYDHSNLYKYLIGNGYPICISNNTDPFCKNNIECSDILESVISENGNSIFWQTKGGDNNRILDILARHPQNNYLYCTIEFPNDKIRKKLCPDAPSIESRLELIAEAKKIGIPIWVGISPTNIEWFEEDNYESLNTHIDKLVVAGANIINFNVIRYEKNKDIYDAIIGYCIDCNTDFYDADVEFIQHMVPMPAELKSFNHIKKHIPTTWEIRHHLGIDTLDFEETPFEKIYDTILKISDVGGFFEYEFNTAEFSAMNQSLIKFNECNGLKNMKQVFNYLYNKRRILI